LEEQKGARENDVRKEWGELMWACHAITRFINDKIKLIKEWYLPLL
jgi:hypothetical protein